MEPLRPSIPVGIPTPEEIARAQELQLQQLNGGGTSDVGGQVLTGPSALDSQPDSRLQNQRTPATPATPSAKPTPGAKPTN
jgi:hypothetical protein